MREGEEDENDPIHMFSLLKCTEHREFAMHSDDGVNDPSHVWQDIAEENITIDISVRA